MRIIFNVFLLVFLLGFTSCRDHKKEEADEAAMVEMIDSIQQEASSLTEQVEADAKELEAALNELDSI